MKSSDRKKIWTDLAREINLASIDESKPTSTDDFAKKLFGLIHG